jgi:hypothetical protein
MKVLYVNRLIALVITQGHYLRRSLCITSKHYLVCDCCCFKEAKPYGIQILVGHIKPLEFDIKDPCGYSSSVL